MNIFVSNATAAVVLACHKMQALSPDKRLLRKENKILSEKQKNLLEGGKNLIIISNSFNFICIFSINSETFFLKNNTMAIMWLGKEWGKLKTLCWLSKNFAKFVFKEWAQKLQKGGENCFYCLMKMNLCFIHLKIDFMEKQI